MKNLTYHGVSSFLPALHKIINEDKYADFWGEINHKRYANVNTNYNLSSGVVRFDTLHDLVSFVVDNAKTLSSEDVQELVNTLLRISFLFDRRYVFMVAVKDEIEAEVTNDVVVSTPVVSDDETKLEAQIEESVSESTTEITEESLTEDTKVDNIIL